VERLELRRQVLEGLLGIQAEDAKQDNQAEVEAIRNAQGKAEEYTYHSGPACTMLLAMVLKYFSTSCIQGLVEGF